MKKIFLSIIFFILLLPSNFALSIDDDYLYLSNLFSDVSIDMSLALEEKNLKVTDVINELKTIYKATASESKEKKEGIDKKALANAISETYAKYSNKNSHMSILSNNDFFVPFEHKFVYYSEVYFKKENNSYLVYDNYKNIKKGMRYTGNVANLFKTLHEDQVLYVFGTFSSENIKKAFIAIENNVYEVAVYGNIGSAKYRKDYEFKKIDKCVYLKIENCNYSDKNLEKKFFEDSEKFIKDFKNADSIIFDLRNNLGGFSKYLNQFTYALIFDRKTNENDLKFSNWIRTLSSGNKRINTMTMINKTRSVGLAPKDYINMCLENLNQKYLIETKEEKVILNPWYKGKIYVLINPLTCSAAEEFSITLKKIFGENVIIVGQNSNGSLDFTDVYSYVLPASKIQLRLCAVDYRGSNLLEEDCWHGDTMGIFPDYWCKPQDIVTLLSKLMRNEKLKKFIKL